MAQALEEAHEPELTLQTDSVTLQILQILPKKRQFASVPCNKLAAKWPQNGNPAISVTRISAALGRLMAVPGSTFPGLGLSPAVPRLAHGAVAMQEAYAVPFLTDWDGNRNRDAAHGSHVRVEACPDNRGICSQSCLSRDSADSSEQWRVAWARNPGKSILLSGRRTVDEVK